MAVSGDIFSVLGVQPDAGPRLHCRGDESRRRGVLFSHGLWKRAFSSDPKIVGQQVNLAGKSYTLLGIMPPGWQFPLQGEYREHSDYIMPLEPLVATEVPRRGSHFLRLVGRLKPDVSAAQAEAELKPIASPHGRAISGHEYRTRRPRDPVARRCRRRRAAGALDLVRRGCARAPDRVRERGQSSARPGGGTEP